MIVGAVDEGRQMDVGQKNVGIDMAGQRLPGDRHATVPGDVPPPVMTLVSLPVPP